MTVGLFTFYNGPVRKISALLLVIFSLILIGARPALGQSVSGTDTTPATVGPSSALPRLTSQKVLLIQELGNRLADRMEAAINRLQKLVDRVQSRVSKLQATGQDVKQFKNWIASMTINLESAQTALTKFRGDLSALTPDDNPQKDLRGLQLDIKMTKDALTATLTTLKLTVQALTTVSAVPAFSGP